MNDMNSPFGPGREKAKNYPEHTPLANRPEVECEFRKIYTVAAMARQKRTDVRSKVDVIIWDLTGYFGRNAGAIMGGPLSKNGEFENRTIKDGKRTNLRTINLYRPRGSRRSRGSRRKGSRGRCWRHLYKYQNRQRPFLGSTMLLLFFCCNGGSDDRPYGYRRKRPR